MKTKLLVTLVATLAGGFGMWLLAGLWHNLILPLMDKNVQAHHDGLIIMMIAYFILAFLLTYLYMQNCKGEKTILEGLKIGVAIGVLWVFPHGLAMAGAHGTSILYEVQNMLWHIIEQGIGGIIIAAIIGKRVKTANENVT